MRFDPSVTLGSIIHLVVLLAVIVAISRSISTIMKRIEDKQDRLLSADRKSVV